MFGNLLRLTTQLRSLGFCTRSILGGSEDRSRKIWVGGGLFVDSGFGFNTGLVSLPLGRESFDFTQCRTNSKPSEPMVQHKICMGHGSYLEVLYKAFSNKGLDPTLVACS